MSAADSLSLGTAMSLAGSSRRDFSRLGLRAAVYCLLFSVIFFPEFPRSGDPGVIYEKVAFGFRMIDVAILAVAFVHLTFAACLRSRKICFPHALAIPGLAFLGCIVMAALYGASRGGSNFFFDWRGLALGIALYIVWSFWLQNSEDLRYALQCLAAYTAVRLLLLYIFYALGYRDILFGMSIPLFDGPILSAIVCAVLLALSSQQRSTRISAEVGWAMLGAAGGFMVLLCMRRTYWAELGVGCLILVVAGRRRQAKTLMVLAVLLCTVSLVLGPIFLHRVESMNVTRSDTQFSVDNADHLNDLSDAWYQLRNSPIFGIGLGTSYPTWHIRNWKPESVMVHNAPLHVWLKYGIAGLVCYLWFHIALLRWLHREARAADDRQGAFVMAAFSYLTAQFIVTLGFAPWPYSELQLTVLISFLLAGVVASSASTSPRHA